MEILASAYSVPATRIENEQLREFMDTSDEWIRERTGIKTRHVVTDQRNFDLAYDVAQQLLENRRSPPISSISSSWRP